MSGEEFSPKEVLERFGAIAKQLGRTIFTSREQLTPSLEIVVANVKLRSLRDFDDAVAAVESAFDVQMLSEAEAKAIVAFRRSVKKEHRLSDLPDEMSLNHALRDGRLRIEDIGQLGRKLTLYPAPSRPSVRRREDRLDPRPSPSDVESGAASRTPPARPTCDGAEEVSVGRRSTGPPSEARQLDGSLTWAPTELVTLCISNRGIAFELRVSRHVAHSLQSRLTDMGVHVAMDTPPKRRAPCTITMWLDPIDDDGSAEDV